MSDVPGELEDAEQLAAELGQRLAKGQARVEEVAARRMRYLEGGIGLVILVGFLGRWVQAEWAELGTHPGGEAGAAVVEQVVEQVASQVIVAGALVGGIACLIGLAVAAMRLPGPGSVLARVRDWWTARASHLREGPSIAVFLVAFGVYLIAPFSVAPLLPTSTLVIEAPAARRVSLSLFGLALEPGGGVNVPGLPKDRLRVVPAGDGARLIDQERLRRAAAGKAPPEPLALPILVDGAPVTSADVVVRPGASFQVGELRAHVEPLSPAGRRDRIALITLGTLLGAVLIVLGAWRFGGAAGVRRLGLVPEGLGAEVVRGVAGGLALLPVYSVVLLAWTAVGRAIGAPLQSHQLIEELGRNSAPGLWPVVALSAAVVAPLGEELLFRGLLLPGYARVVGPLAAVVASSLVFGAMHSGFQPLLAIGLVGAMCALLAATSPRRSLVGSIVAHGLFNGIQLAAAFAALSS